MTRIEELELECANLSGHLVAANARARRDRARIAELEAEVARLREHKATGRYRHGGKEDRNIYDPHGVYVCRCDTLEQAKAIIERMNEEKP